MKKTNIAGTVKELLSPTADEMNLILWDVEYVKEGSGYVLRVTIDSEEGVTIDDCERFHRAIDPILDEADPIETSYTLEVSSPGIERELRTAAHFEACRGWDVEVHLFAPKDGQKVFYGELQGLDENEVIHILDGEGRVSDFPKQDVAQVKTVFNFDDLES